MKSASLKLLFALLFYSQFSFGQQSDNAAILKVILSKYYQDEKVIKAGRLQLLDFYCKKAPNNEEVIEVINKNESLKKSAAEIKHQINDKVDEDWSAEMAALFATENQYLKSKVNDCFSLEDYQKISTRFDLHNQRLLIVGKPIYFDKNKVLVKITFYRNIEHNSGNYLLMEKQNSVWEIKETLNAWST